MEFSVAAGGDGGASGDQATGAQDAWQQEAAAAVVAAVDGLLRLTLPSGNLRSSLGSDSDRCIPFACSCLSLCLSLLVQCLAPP